MSRPLILGDHVYVQRSAYTHHGIWMGENRVIHYTGEPGDIANAVIAVAPVADFLKKSKAIYILEYPSLFVPEEVVRRALSRLGEKRFNLAANNCEHFATWCRLGKSISMQVERVQEVAKTVGEFALHALLKAIR